VYVVTVSECQDVVAYSIASLSFSSSSSSYHYHHDYLAWALSSSLAFNTPMVDMNLPSTPLVTTGTTTLVAEKEVRQGLYGEYTVEKSAQKVSSGSTTS